MSTPTPTPPPPGGADITAALARLAQARTAVTQALASIGADPVPVPVTERGARPPVDVNQLVVSTRQLQVLLDELNGVRSPTPGAPRPASGSASSPGVGPSVPPSTTVPTAGPAVGSGGASAPAGAGSPGTPTAPSGPGAPAAGLSQGSAATVSPSGAAATPVPAPAAPPSGGAATPAPATGPQPSAPVPTPTSPTAPIPQAATPTTATPASTTTDTMAASHLATRPGGAAASPPARAYQDGVRLAPVQDSGPTRSAAGILGRLQPPGTARPALEAVAVDHRGPAAKAFAVTDGRGHAGLVTIAQDLRPLGAAASPAEALARVLTAAIGRAFDGAEPPVRVEVREEPGDRLAVRLVPLTQHADQVRVAPVLTNPGFDLLARAERGEAAAALGAAVGQAAAAGGEVAAAPAPLNPLAVAHAVAGLVAHVMGSMAAPVAAGGRGRGGGLGGAGALLESVRALATGAAPSTANAAMLAGVVASVAVAVSPGPVMVRLVLCGALLAGAMSFARASTRRAASAAARRLRDLGLRYLDRWADPDELTEAVDHSDAVPDPYKLLGLRPGASWEQVKAAQRTVLRRLHPDANPGVVAEVRECLDDLAKIINAAVDLLRAELALGRRQPARG